MNNLNTHRGVSWIVAAHGMVLVCAPILNTLYNPGQIPVGAGAQASTGAILAAGALAALYGFAVVGGLLEIFTNRGGYDGG